jgi:hypothetical protein
MHEYLIFLFEDPVVSSVDGLFCIAIIKIHAGHICHRNLYSIAMNAIYYSLITSLMHVQISSYHQNTKLKTLKRNTYPLILM